MTRLLNRGSIGLFVIALISIGSTVPASAGVGANQPCAHGGNKISTSCVNGKNGDVYYGAFDDFKNVALGTIGSSSSNPIHINQEMWFYTHSDESQWVEVGIRQGYWVPCNCSTYATFWADFDSSFNEHRHTIVYSSGDNTEHSYEVLRDSSNHQYWDIYYDYNYVGQSTDQASVTGYEIQHGLETTNVDSSNLSALANHSPLEYMNGSGAFVHDPYQQLWVDSQCPGTTTAYTCLTGYGNGSDVWEAAHA